VAQVKNKYTLWLLTWPIFIETFLQFLLGAADTLMVSRISDDAVAVVGISNQLFNALMVLFMTVSSGAGILIAQRIGSGRQEDARRIGIISFNVSVGIGLVLSIGLALFAREIAVLLQVPGRLLPLAETYISLVGGSMLLTAAAASLSNTIRNTGNTKGPMVTALGMNVIHVVLNYGFIFGALGLPQLGLQGVAISTVVSRLAAVVLLLFLFRDAFARRIGLRDMPVFDRRLFGDVLRIGWPMGVNMSCWVLTQLVIYTFIAGLGPAELAARTYMNTLESFCFLLGYSVAAAVQIQIAHLYGAGRLREAYKAAYRAIAIGLVLVMVNAVLLFLFGEAFIRLFTRDTEIMALSVSLIVFNLVLQPGKMLNMGLGGALAGVGDTRFQMYVSLLSMWAVATGLSWYLGVHAGWGLAGIYVGMICDEYFRGLVSLKRWREQKVLRRAELQQQTERLNTATV